MTRTEEKRLAVTANKAKKLREGIVALDTFVRSWARLEKTRTPDMLHIYLSVPRGFMRSWNASCDVPCQLIGNEFLPIVKKVRARMLRELRELQLP